MLGPLPWAPEGTRRPWEDNDNSGLYWYLEKYYQISSNGKVDGALSLHSNAHAFNEVTDYLDGFTGTERNGWIACLSSIWAQRIHALHVP